MVILFLIIFIAICFILFIIFFIKWSEAKITSVPSDVYLKNVPGNLYDDSAVDFEDGKAHSDRVLEEVIPILKETRDIPGLGVSELVHFVGSGRLYTVESEEMPDKIKIDRNNLNLVLEGTVAITSKNLLIFNRKDVKKFPHGKIERLGWENGFLIIKRKGVKKKREVFEVHESGPFRYILKALHTK